MNALIECLAIIIICGCGVISILNFRDLMVLKNTEDNTEDLKEEIEEIKRSVNNLYAYLQEDDTNKITKISNAVNKKLDDIYRRLNSNTQAIGEVKVKLKKEEIQVDPVENLERQDKYLDDIIRETSLVYAKALDDQDLKRVKFPDDTEVLQVVDDD